MTRFRRSAATALIATSLTACTNPDTVVFVTKTSFGIDLDGQQASVAIGLDRAEGFVGPRYDNGAAPPIVASLQSGGLLSPYVRQIYATGKAAQIATAPVLPTPSPPGPATPLVGDKKMMFFGTQTTIGLKAGFSPPSSGSLLESFTFGYKRKEASVIPVGKGPRLVKTDDGTWREATAADAAGNTVQVDTYPSVLAAIDTSAKVQGPTSTELGVDTFFATGDAAENLAGTAEVRKTLSNRAADAMQAFTETKRAQLEEEVNVLGCYAQIEAKNWAPAWDSARRLRIVDEEGVAYSKSLVAQAAQARAADDAAKADGLTSLAHSVYVTAIAGAEGHDAERARLLLIHRDEVCALRPDTKPLISE